MCETWICVPKLEHADLGKEERKMNQDASFPRLAHHQVSYPLSQYILYLTLLSFIPLSISPK